MSNEYHNYYNQRKSFWDKVWEKRGGKKGLGKYYHNRLLNIYTFLIPPQATVLEIGSGNGHLIGNLPNEIKTGIDFSSSAITLSKSLYPDCNFIQADIMELKLEHKFDYIILSDLLGDLWDIELVLDKLRMYCHPNSKIIFNYYSKLWEFPLRIAQKLRLKKPNLTQNWVTTHDVKNLLNISDYEVIKSWQEILLPINIPIFTWFFNRFLSKVFLLRQFDLSNFLVARIRPEIQSNENELSVSVIVAARNESGHIRELIERLPPLGKSTELIFVEGGSTDDTYEKIESEIGLHPDRTIKLFRQTGKGKGDAVRKGFEEAQGDILMILDADLTVPPEKLPQFYKAITSGKGEFINGVRLVYPMEKGAMRSFNLVGNKFFSLAFSWVLGQPIKDTLCGTKVLLKSDYIKIRDNRTYFGEFDPFGDFDLIFGAAKQNMKIIDLPIRYQERTYGETNISRWSHGILLFRMLLFSLSKIKFI